MGRAQFRVRPFAAGMLLLAVLPLAGRSLTEGPSLVIDESAPRTYDESLTVSGQVIPAPDIGVGDNRVDILTWEIPELKRFGYIMFHRSGRFVRSIPVGDYREPLTLVLTLTDRVGRSDTRSIRYTYKAREYGPAVPEKSVPAEADGPVIVIASPGEGEAYRSFVDVSGRVRGRPSRMSWVAEELGAQGPIEFGDDGAFSFAFSTAGFSEDLRIQINAVFEDTTETVFINLVPDRSGPFLEIASPRDSGFYADTVAVSGIVGRDPAGVDGLREVKGLYWWFEGQVDGRRPVFFDGEGRFDFEIDFRDKTDDVAIRFSAEDLNGNVTERVIGLLDGRLPPGLSVDFPSNDTAYGTAGLIISGTLEDPYIDERDYGGIETLSWDLLSDDPRWSGGATGAVSSPSPGSFRLPMLPGEISGNAVLQIEVLGVNGVKTSWSTALRGSDVDLPGLVADGRDNAVHLSWPEVPGAEIYVVTVSAPGSESIEVSVADPADRTTIGSLKNGELYTFSLRAETDRGPFSSNIVRAIPLAGNELQPTAEGSYRQVRLSWTDIPGSSEYRVLRRSADQDAYDVIADSVNGIIYVDETARFGVDYLYAVAPAAFPHQMSNPTSARTLEAPEQKFEEVARYEGLVPRDLRIVGDYAFVAAGTNGFRIIDVSNPVKPVVVGETETGDARGVAVFGDYAYLADEERGLQVINIIAPSTPLAVGSRLAGRPAGVAVKGTWAYVADVERGLRVYDVSSARSPRRVTFLEGFSALGIRILGSTAFIPAGEQGLALVDLTDPDSPVLSSLLDVGDARHVAVGDDLACISDSRGGLIFVDISDHNEPEILSRISGADAGHLELRNGYVFVSTIGGGLSVYDARNPRNPVFFESTDLERLGSLAFKDDYLYAGTPSGIMVIQTYLVGSSYAVEHWKTPGRSHGVSVHGGEVAVADHDAGVQIRRIADAREQTISTPYASAAYLSQDALAVADDVAGIEFYTRSESDGRWERIAPMKGTPPASDIAAATGIVAGTCPDTGIYVWRTTKVEANQDPEIIPITGPTRVSVDPLHLAVAGPSGFRVFSTSGETITLLGEVPRTGIKDIAVNGREVYVVGEFGLSSYHISDSGNIDRVGRFSSPHARRISVEGSFAYISAGPDGLQIVNTSNPDKLFLSSECLEVFAVDAALNDDGTQVYVADTDGVQVVDIVIPPWLR